MRKIAAYFVMSVALLFAAAGYTVAQQAVHIDFDTLPNNTIVSNQYPQVTFSSENIYFHPPFTWNYCGYCLTSSAPNYVTSGVGYGNGNHEVILAFNQPVKNLTFYTVGGDNFGTIAQIDIWENGNYARTVNLPGVGYAYYPVFTDLRSYGNSITRLRIYNIVDPYGLGFDDFDFTPVEVQRVDITNPRVSGSLNGTTQNALLGANVSLQANITPAGLTGGTYSWFIPAPYQLVSGTINSPSLTVYWTQPGTYQARVTYTRNGVEVQGTVNVNVVVPTLPSYYANRETDLLGRGPLCGDAPYVWSLGCRSFPGGEGMNFFATAEIPTGQYLSDPAQTGIKFVQILSTVRKVRYESGTVHCLTGRSGEDDPANSWRIDNRPGESGDPHDNSSDAVRYFSQGNSLTITTRDSPAQGFPILDAVKVDDRFQSLLVYFAGGTPSVPNFQRRLGSLSWSWGGQYVYDSSAGNIPFRKQFTFGLPPGTYQRDAVTSSATYQGLNSDLDFAPCPWGPAPIQNQIDSTRFFVRWHYLEVLNRQPDGAWDAWVSFITQCGFDNTCINNWRIAVSRGFFESAEFRQDKPALTYPGTPEYNAEYVRQLYLVYLDREPDGAYYAWLDYLNSTGDYTGVVSGFINSIEYRQRFGPP